MTIASTRAQDVAIILWELKKAEKLATLSSIAERAGFSPGHSFNTISNCLKTVRRDWPHLEWWRAVADNGQLQTDQVSYLERAGFATTSTDGGIATVNEFGEQLMDWSESEKPLPVAD